MDKRQRPHGREKEVLSGTAHVGKGKRVNTGGAPAGTGGRPGASGPIQDRRFGGQRKSGIGTAAAVAGGLFLLSKLPPKLRRVVLIILVVIVGIALLRGCHASTQQDYIPDAAPVTGPQAPAPFSQAAADPPAAEAPAAPPAATAARGYYYQPGGNDTVTIMIYMCGTDLESNYGMATSDLQEMVNADLDDSRVHLLIETGGCRRWKNNVVSSTLNETYEVHSGGRMNRVRQMEATPMTDPDNLTDFIRFCSQNYPADRNILIFWDHGGGSLQGYGYDEKFASSSSMTLSKINAALGSAGVKFDWIGFDACLMATLETDLVCERYADYLIASEETEPGTGWYYTDWLTALSRNPSIPTTDLARIIIDTYVTSSCQSAANAQVTLSVVDLAELSGAVPAAFKAFSRDTAELSQSDYSLVSSARSGVRQFAAGSKLNQVDLIDLCHRLGTEEAGALAESLSACVKYNRSTITRSYGVSIYFPYESLRSMNSAISTYHAIGFDEEYTNCIKTFASIGQGSQIGSSASTYSGYPDGNYADMSDLLGTLLGGYSPYGVHSSPAASNSSYGGYTSSAAQSLLGSLMGGFSNAYGGQSAGYSISADDIVSLMSAFSGRSMPAGMEWVDTDVISRNAEAIADNSIDPARIAVTEKNGTRVLSLTEEEWAKIHTAELNVFVDDGEGHIDLGLDNTFAWDDDGDMLLDWDGTWFTVNGRVAAIYLVSDTENPDGSYTTVSRVPVLLKTPEMKEPVFMNLQVVFDAAHPTGNITGAYPLYEGETDTQSKGMLPVAEGSEIQFLCDYYRYDGAYQATYTLGDRFIVTGDLVLGNMQMDAGAYSVTYRLTDLFGNHYWTPAYRM